MPPATVRATRVRYWVIVFAVSLAVITYIDRVSIATAAPYIQHDVGLDDVQMGWAFSAFAWAYALFEIPGGFLGDWMGPRRVLLRVVAWWSFFTAATGWAFSAFAWAYALFEIPGGFLGDWMGPRRVLLRVVAWWSFFTAATGWAF